MPNAASPSVESSSRGGPSRLLVGTAIGGGTGYLVTAFAGSALGPGDYAPFAVFWSALYLVIAALTGVQQEIARSATPVEFGTQTTRPVARNFGAWAAAIVFVVVVASGWAWMGGVFPVHGWSMVVPLGVGVACYVVVGTMLGVFYGLTLWNAIALQMSVDGLLRLALVLIVLSVSKDTVLLSWAVVLPIVVTPIILWAVVRRRVVGRFTLDVGYRELTWNVARTVVASAAMGVMVSGLPLLIHATSQGESDTKLGVVIFSIMLLRAPVVIVVMALQSYLIVFFQERQAQLWRWLSRIVVLVLVGASLASLIVWWIGPVVVVALFGEAYRLDGGLLALLVVSAGPVGALCATGSAALARSRHGAFLSGWVVAAALTVVMFVIPNTLEVRTVLALIVGPVVGLIIHLVLLAKPDRMSEKSEPIRET